MSVDTESSLTATTTQSESERDASLEGHKGENKGIDFQARLSS